MSETRCERFGKWIGGCQFEPRYDHRPPEHSFKQGSASDEMAMKAIELLSTRTYVGDVCIRCGKQVTRP